MTGIDYKRMNRRINVKRDERKRSEWTLTFGRA